MNKEIRKLSIVISLVILVATIAACAAPAAQTPPAPAASEPAKPAAAAKPAEVAKPAESAKPAEPAKPAAQQPAAKPASGPLTVIYSALQNASTLDPHFAYGYQYLTYGKNVFEGLAETLPASTEVRPQLAKEWTISPDKLVYTFKLRDDVLFHDGSPFDSSAVVASYDRIKGYNKGRVYLMNFIKSYAAKDKYTFEITLKNPYPYFLEAVARLLIINPKELADHKAADDPWAEKWFAAQGSGTRP